MQAVTTMWGPYRIWYSGSTRDFLIVMQAAKSNAEENKNNEIIEASSSIVNAIMPPRERVFDTVLTLNWDFIR